MAITVTGIDHRNSDYAHAWGDDPTDVWIGRNDPNNPVTLPRNTEQAKAFLQKYLPLGWLEESGVAIETSIDSQKFKAMQGSATIKHKITGIERSFTVQALEENLRVTNLYWDHDKPKMVAAGETLIDIKATMNTIDAWSILNFVEGEFFKIFVFPSINITDRGTLNHSNKDLSVYQLKCEIVKNGWMITNNPAYLEGMDEKAKTDFSAANQRTSTTSAVVSPS